MITKIKTKIAWWVAHRLPARVVLYVIALAFVNASTGKWGGAFPDRLGYKEVFDRWVEKHNIKQP